MIALSGLVAGFGFGLFLGGAVMFCVGVAYGVHSERERFVRYLRSRQRAGRTTSIV